jgi:hypothetical protein
MMLGMNKIDDAWEVLKRLSPREQEQAADAILDYASRSPALQLSDKQANEVKRRMSDDRDASIDVNELRACMKKFTA